MAKQSKKEADIQKRTVFAIQPPSDQDSKFVLIVSRGSSMFGGGGGSAAFAVDGVHAQIDPSNKAYAVRGFRDRGPGNANATVVEFPLGTPYIMVERSSLRLMTPIEAQQESIAEEKELLELEKELGPISKKPAEELVHPSGQPVGGYR